MRAGVGIDHETDGATMSATIYTLGIEVSEVPELVGQPLDAWELILSAKGEDQSIDAMRHLLDD